MRSLIALVGTLLLAGWMGLEAAPLAYQSASPPDSITFEQGATPVQELSGARIDLGATSSNPVLIQLADEPVVVVWERSLNQGGLTVAARNALASASTMNRLQDSVQARIEAGGGRVLYRLQRVLNGLVAEVPADGLAWLSTDPEVKMIRPLPLGRNAVLNGLAPFGVPSNREGPATAGLLGQGISVGIIDDGLDYIHTDFGGSGLASDHARNNPAVITDSDGFPNAKVAGGYDFVGDAYDALSSDPARRVPRPDPDPFPCEGHGTHVAGSIGGYGVNSDGSTFSGPWGTEGPAQAFRITPGLAPMASLYPLRVFGCGGSGTSTVYPLALEWASDPNGDFDFSDHLDLVNLSLVIDFGGPGADPTAEAADNAARAGVIVVAAAGNARDTYFITDSPAIADRAIGVAASTLTPTDGLADFSARGPRRYDGFLKPDLSAPGVDIVSARAGSGQGAVSASGTSMSSPQVAGVLALLRELHRDWTVAELKALVMNTAEITLKTSTGAPYSPSRQGAGGVTLPAALTSTLIAYDAGAPQRVSLSFGLIDVVDSTAFTRTVTVANKGTTPMTVAVSVGEVVTSAGVTLEPLSSTVSVPANGRRDFQVRLRLEAGRINRTLDPATSSSQFGLPRQFINEHAGYVILSGPTQTVKVPFQAAVRPASSIQTGGVLSFADNQTSSRLQLTGQGVLQPGYLSRSWALELQAVFPERVSGPAGQFQKMAQLQYIGIGADSPSGSALSPDQRVHAGVAVQGPWTTPNGQDVVIEVEIDTNRDGGPDFLLRNEGYSRARTSDTTPDDVHLAALYAVSGSNRFLVATTPLNGFDATTETAPFSSTVMILSARAGDLGLATGTSRLNYRISTRLYERPLGVAGQVIDQSGWLSFDPAAPALTAAGGNGDLTSLGPGVAAPIWLDQPGNEISVRFNPRSAVLDRPLGLLLLHPLNSTARQSEIITLTQPISDQVFFPAVVRGQP